MSTVRLFVSFDRHHDKDLHARLVEQTLQMAPGFELSSGSEGGPMSAPWDKRSRRRIREADEVIVICGEHTDEAERVSAELRMAREEGTPYFLLWGRPQSMVTKPASARSTDGIYKWTWEILQDQIRSTVRGARFRQGALAEHRRPPPTG